MSDLTPLARIVRRSLLNYPTLYRSRLDVLAHLYLVLGNGFDWTRKGTLRDIDAEPDTGKIDMDDLIDPLSGLGATMRRALVLDERAYGLRGRDKEHLTASEVSKTEAQDAEYKRRLFVEANVDMLASTPQPHGNFSRPGHYEEPENVVRYFDDNYCLGRMPSRVERSFKEGALEVLNVVIRDADPKYLSDLRRVRAVIEAKEEI